MIIVAVALAIFWGYILFVVIKFLFPIIRDEFKHGGDDIE